MNIKLDIPKISDLRPRISVIGIGGAGCNAINNMIATGLEGVEFVAANTDAQALAMSQAEHQIQLGAELTEGLGAGARPEVGRGAAEEAIDEIRAQIEGNHMVFLAAGMGGGTGTGAISVIARVAREMDILTVAIVSKPFQFEGSRRMRTAEVGIKELSDQVDTLIVIPNQNLFRIANQKTTFAEAFVLADQVLYSGIACIVDLIVKDGLINLDFADVKAVMKGMGSAMMGTGEATGDERATLAAEKAIANPLLDEISLRGARGLLVSIIGGQNLTLFEVDEAASRVKSEAHPDANIIVGASFEDEMENKIRVSIVAAGFDQAGSYHPDVEDAQRTLQSTIRRTPDSSASMASPVPELNSSSMGAATGAISQGMGVELTDGVHTDQVPDQTAGIEVQSDEEETSASGADIRVANSEIPLSERSSQPDLAPPPIPSQFQAAQDPYLGDTPAEEFAKALEDVIKSVADESSPSNQTRDAVWTSPNGVAIREGLDGLSPGGAPPLPHTQAPMAYHGNDEFAAQPPADMPRRVPDISQFPPIAQQEFETRQDVAGPESELVEQQDRGMPGLLRRIAGFGRQGATLTDSVKKDSGDQPSRTRGQQSHNVGDGTYPNNRR